jgi:rod shape determining protein RodA
MKSKSHDYVRQIDSYGLGRKRSWWAVIHIDPWLLLFLMVLTAYGFVVLYSAADMSVPTLKKQGTFFLIAYIGMLIVAQVPMHFLRRLAPMFFCVGVLLLLLVPLIGVGAKGAVRWLDLPGLPRFQPSEVLKTAMPLTIAWWVTKKNLPPSFAHIVGSLILIFIPVLLIASQPDLGTSILVAASGVFVLLFAGLLWRYIFGAVFAVLLAAWPMWHFMLHDYQKNRILTLFDPERDKFGTGWNIIQSTTAIGSGGWDGKGWLKGTQSHLNFLPESHTDFIIAVLSEEFGYKGVLLLLILYFAIIFRGLYIAWNATSNFNQLVASSVTLTFFIYVFVNMGMVSGLLPIVGVPLPLVSQGGTSIVTLMLGFGLLMAIASDKQQFTREV